MKIRENVDYRKSSSFIELVDCTLLLGGDNSETVVCYDTF